MILVSHDPFTHDSPYRPDQLTARQLSVRAFDEQAMMIEAAVVAGTDLGQTLDAFFADTATAVVHVHNASRGCWAVTVRRHTLAFSGVKSALSGAKTLGEVSRVGQRPGW